MAENKGFDLTSVLKNVPGMGTGREQIEYIDIDRLASDTNNFYSLDGVDELAANIELVGLQQPLRVRVSPIDANMYTIVSGHRRRAALLLLIKDGREDLREVPCIVEQSAESSAMQELRLIYANSDTRKMSSADISRQAERVETLLYQLKEEGVEFPGRMRDHVAEACRVSKSKLARLKVIRENLIPAFLTDWNAGNLSETVAYEIAKRDADYQTMLKVYRLPKGKSVLSLNQWNVTDFYNNIDKLCTRECKLNEGHLCSFKEGVLKRYQPGLYCRCFDNCCADCYGLATCENSCDKCAEIKAQKQAEHTKTKLEVEAARQQREEKNAEREKMRQLEYRKFWLRISEAADAAGVGASEIMTAADWGDMDKDNVALIESYLDGSADNIEGGLDCLLSDDMDYLVPLADLLGVSIDYLFGREGYDGRAVCKWQTGTPPTRGLYYAKFDVEGTVIRQVAEYDDYTQKWYFSHGASIAADCVGWYKLPESKEDK